MFDLRDKRPPLDWIETLVNGSPFLAFCFPEEQSAYLSTADDFRLLVANKRTLVASLEQSVAEDEADGAKRDSVKAWGAAVFERTGAAAAATAGTAPVADLGQAAAPLVCFATLVYWIAVEAETRREKLAGFLAAEAIAAAAATLATRGGAHPGPFWDPSQPEIVAGYAVTQGAELSDVFCVAVLARCAAMLATRGGTMMPLKRLDNPPSSLLDSLVELAMVPVKFVRAAAASAPPHLSVETRGIWQHGMAAAALFMVYGQGVGCWPRRWDDYDDYYEESLQEEGDGRDGGGAAPPQILRHANFFAAYLGALGSFCNFDTREHPWGAELLKEAVLYALIAYHDEPLTDVEARIVIRPGFEYFLKGAVPPAADAACYPCLPTDVLSLRGLAYILALRQNFNYSDSITGGVCFANFLKDAGIDADYVDELEWKLENAATCVLASFYRTVCQFDVLGDVVESGLLDVLFTEEEYTAFPTTEYYHGELGFTGREAVADAFVQRPGLLAAILARWTATKGGCKALPERARKVLGNFLQLVARNLNPYQGTFCAALDNGHATHYLGVVADVVGPACLTLANLQAVKPMGSLFDDIPLKDAVWYALYISKKLAYEFEDIDWIEEDCEHLAAIHRSTLGLAVAALGGGHMLDLHWGTEEYEKHASSLLKLMAHVEFTTADIAAILDRIKWAPTPSKNGWLHRQFWLSPARGVVAGRPGEGFPYTPIPLFSSCATLLALLLREEPDDGPGRDTAKAAMDLLQASIGAAAGDPCGKLMYDRYRKAAPLAHLSLAIAGKLTYFRRDHSRRAIPLLTQAVAALDALGVKYDASVASAPSEAVAWDANEEQGLGDDPEGAARGGFARLLASWGTIFNDFFDTEVHKVLSTGQAGDLELVVLLKDLEAVGAVVETLARHYSGLLALPAVVRKAVALYAIVFLAERLPLAWRENIGAVKNALDRALIPRRVADRAMAVLLAEEEVETREAEEKRRLKRQRQKEKQRAAKEAEAAAAAAAEAAQIAEKERVEAEQRAAEERWESVQRAAEERREEARRAQQAREAAERAIAEAAAIAAAATEAARKREAKRKKKATKRVEKLAARAAQPEAPPPPPLRPPLGPLPPPEQAPPPTPNTDSDLDHLLSVLLPGGGANQENRGASSSAPPPPPPPGPASPVKLPGALGRVTRDPLRWAAMLKAMSCPLDGTVFSEPLILMDGGTYDGAAAGRLGAGAAGARPNLTMRALVRELRDKGCAL